MSIYIIFLAAWKRGFLTDMASARVNIEMGKILIFFKYLKIYYKSVLIKRENCGIV